MAHSARRMWGAPNPKFNCDGVTFQCLRCNELILLCMHCWKKPTKYNRYNLSYFKNHHFRSKYNGIQFQEGDDAIEVDFDSTSISLGADPDIENQMDAEEESDDGMDSCDKSIDIACGGINILIIPLMMRRKMERKKTSSGEIHNTKKQALPITPQHFLLFSISLETNLRLFFFTINI